MSAPNPFVASGTCFHGPGEEVKEWFPCGNAALGDKTCCQGGDMCLSSHACYNGRFGVTYLAGCSDPDYRHPSCPDKGGLSDQPWTGLVYCNGTSEEWVACKQSARPTTLTSADACWCPEETARTVAFTDASILANVVQLPTSLGGSVIWQPGYVPIPTQPNTIPTPTSLPTKAQTTAVMTTGQTSILQPTETEAGPGRGNGGFTTGSKIGIGVGAACGSVFLAAVLIYLYFARRRWRERTLAEREFEEMNGTDSGQAGWMTDSRKSSAKPEPTAELEPTAARPWSTRTELDSTPVSRYGNEQHDLGAKRTRPIGPIAELPG